MTDFSNYPNVSILTPTYNRSAFMPLILNNLKRINYDQSKLEWCVLDDGNIPLIKIGRAHV